MELKPVVQKDPGYPGFRKLNEVIESWTLILKVRITVPICLGLILTAASIFPALGSEDGKKEGTPSNSSKSSGRDIEPCSGKIAPPDPPEPPPCAGVVAPPPCRGDVGPPYVPPPPERTYRSVSLDEFYRHARDYVGSRLRIKGILNRMSRGRLVDRGYYICADNPGFKSSRFYGCPLVGSPGIFKEGRRVEIEGVVVKRRGISYETNSPGTFFALEIEKISQY